MSALVSPAFLRALAPGVVLPVRADGIVYVPQDAAYVVDGEARPLALDLLEVPALTRLSGAARAVREVAA